MIFHSGKLPEGSCRLCRLRENGTLRKQNETKVCKVLDGKCFHPAPSKTHLKREYFVKINFILFSTVLVSDFRLTNYGLKFRHKNLVFTKTIN